MNNRRTTSITKLPIYRLAVPQLSDEQLDRLATRAFGMKSYAADKVADRMRLSTPGRQFETNLRTGAIWMADQTQLWRPEIKPRLPQVKQAELVASKYLRTHGLLP